MKRVTYYLMKGSENDGYYFKPGVTNEQARERIGLLEDILGDDYDLDHLRKLVEADREGLCEVHVKQNSLISVAPPTFLSHGKE